jgi:hypothetical protein
MDRDMDSQKLSIVLATSALLVTLGALLDGVTTALGGKELRTGQSQQPQEKYQHWWRRRMAECRKRPRHSSSLGDTGEHSAFVEPASGMSV